MYLPDTNIFIRAFNGFEPEASFLKRAISENNLDISVITVAEFYPKAKDVEIEAFDKLLGKFSALEIDEKIAKIAAKYRKQFLRKTSRVFLLDCFLAAQAKIYNLTLVTNNLSDFPMKDIRVVSPN